MKVKDEKAKVSPRESPLQSSPSPTHLGSILGTDVTQKDLAKIGQVSKSVETSEVGLGLALREQ